MRRLDPSDPRSLDHPCHKEQWLQLARALGEARERDDWYRAHPEEKERDLLLRRLGVYAES